MEEPDEEDERGQKMGTWKGTKWQAVWPLNLCTKKIKLTAHCSMLTGHLIHCAHCTLHFRMKKNNKMFRHSVSARRIHRVPSPIHSPLELAHNYYYIVIKFTNINFLRSFMHVTIEAHSPSPPSPLPAPPSYAIDQFYYASVLILQTVAVTRVHKCTYKYIQYSGWRASVVRSNQLVG